MIHARKRSCACCVALLATVATCEVNARADDALRSSALPDRTGGSAATSTLFERLDAERTGVAFAHQWTPPAEKYETELDNAAVAGGVAIGDYDGDGLPDLFLTRPSGGNRLYRNLGDFRFEDVTERAGIRPAAPGSWGGGATFVDIDDDGDLDLYVCGYDHPNRLYVNRGDGTFDERAAELGLDFSGSSVMMAFADYDLDGDLDAYLLTNRLGSEQSESGILEYRDHAWRVVSEYGELYDVINRPDGTRVVVGAGQRDRLYRNELYGSGENAGTLRFTEVGEQAGIQGNHYGLGVAWWDYNDDGLPDLYVSNDFYGPDRLYRNNGNGTFTDVIRTALGHTPWFSMGSDVADINNDGRLDLLSTDMAATTHYKDKVGMGDMSESGWFLVLPEPRQAMQNALYLNSGTERFMEAASLAGLARTDWTWAVKFGDLDNDGWVDLFVTNGMTRDWNNSDLRNRAASLGSYRTAAGRRLWQQTPVRRETNLVFRNRGDLRFEELGADWGLDHLGVSFGAALGDLDRDGDLDLVVNSFEEPVALYRNNGTAGHRVLVRLEGAASNSHGVGATVRVETANGQQLRYLSLSRGFMSANEPIVHVGLGDTERIRRLTVTWPLGHTQHFDDLDVDRIYTLREPDDPRPRTKRRKETPTMFEPSDALALIDHLETPFDDYAEQPLLPNKLSQLGPGLAWGDVDGDGDDDLFVGGGADQPGALYINAGDGDFRRGILKPFREDRGYEDMAPLFFDADGDGDLDLYVVSGSVEFGAESELLRDRLYLNDGRGGFGKSPDGTLPSLRDSGSVVTAADYDRDGDLDLFVGSRVVPGQYPTAPRSRLLRNDGGRFIEVADAVAPALGRSGLVTGAVWSDADGDGWIDLLVSHEWGPVKLYLNRRGMLEDKTTDANLAQHTGWWNGIAAADLDADGDMDYVVTNFGLNTKYTASPLEPATLYFGEFDATGAKRIIEAKLNGDTLLPVRGKSCSQHAVPFIEETLPTYHDFASASLDEIYSPQRLESALRLTATTLESAVLLNDGEARFSLLALPRLAQISPGFGVVLAELDGDGSVDLAIAQNFFPTQPETPRMDGGTGLVLRGNGDGTFEPVWPAESGVVVQGDATALAATDLDGDGWIDLVAAVNDGRLLAFENRGNVRGRSIQVRLRGPQGNPTGVGARVTLRRVDGLSQTFEVHAGASYLTQSAPVLAFGTGPGEPAGSVEVAWPDGARTTSPVAGDTRRLVVEHPAALPPAPRNEPAPAATSTEAAREHTETGHALLARGRVEAAVRHYRRALQLEPRSPEVHAGLGIALAFERSLTEAVDHLNAALELRPDLIEAHIGLGRTREARGEYEAAERHYRKALELDPDHALAHQNLGLLLEQQRRLPAALEHYARAVQLEPGYSGLHRDLARELHQRGDLEAATGHYFQVLVAHPDEAETHYELGNLLHAQRKLDEAITHWQQAARLDPGMAQASFKLGMAFYQLRRFDEAVAHLERCLQIKPDSGDAQYRMGMTLVMTGEPAAALSHLRQAIKLRPDWAEALKATAWLLATHPDPGIREPETAIRLAERARELPGADDPSMLDALAAAYAAADRFELAVATAERALELAQAQQAAGLAGPIGERLELYRKAQPYRLPVP